MGGTFATCQATGHIALPFPPRRHSSGFLHAFESGRLQARVGRTIVHGKPAVAIFGGKTLVWASVPTFGGLSGHAGQTDLLRWLDPFAASGSRVFLTHGKEQGRKPLGKLIKERHKMRVGYPGLNETIEI
jgi:predicted metal-dependent RNase